LGGNIIEHAKFNRRSAGFSNMMVEEAAFFVVNAILEGSYKLVGL